MAANKTQLTDADVSAFLDKLEDQQQRTDADALIALLARVSGQPPKMWGPSIVGFGHYHYRYDSGREGDMARISFSPRKGKTVLYAKGVHPEQEATLAQLGKHKTDGGCIQIKRLADVDIDVLETLCAGSLDYMARKYPETGA